jgi:hypothetical protein
MMALAVSRDAQQRGKALGAGLSSLLSWEIIPEFVNEF